MIGVHSFDSCCLGYANEADGSRATSENLLKMLSGCHLDKNEPRLNDINQVESYIKEVELKTVESFCELMNKDWNLLGKYQIKFDFFL